MPEKLRESVRQNSDLRSALLNGKVRVPPRRPGAVSRRQLVDRARGSRARIVSVTAPAGYGKSTLLSEWASYEQRNVAWATLDRTDGDPVYLLSVLAAAAVSVSPTAEKVVLEMRGVGSAPLSRAAPLLASAIADAQSSFVLFIDDLHWADAPDCQDALEVLLRRVPKGSQVVIASRREPPLIARLRAAGEVHEISDGDLALDTAGARTIFERAGVSEVAEGALTRIVELCEGWPTGLYLCALVERAGGEAVSVTGEDRYIADYLYRECIARLPADVQSFLRRTSILDQLSPASCNALLGIDDSRRRLRELEAANLFLIPLDSKRQWFRYHALFRDYLQGELERVEGADACAELHRRAATWHEEHGDQALAVDHLLEAGEIAQAADRVADLALPMYHAGRLPTVRRWLAELGDDVVSLHPGLAVVTAWAAVLIGDSSAGLRWSRIVDAIEPSTLPDEDGLLFRSARAMLRVAMCEHGHSQAVADAAYAMEHEPEASPWRDQALHLWGSACLLENDVDAARLAFEEAVELATAMGNLDTVVLSEPELALIAAHEKNWDTARNHARHGIEMIDISHTDGYPTSTLALAVAARVALHDGDRASGERLLSRAMRSRVGCTHALPWYSVRARLQIAKAHLALGNHAASRSMMREIGDITHRRPDLGALATEVDRFERRLTTEPVAGAVPLTPAEMRLLPYLQTHLTVAEIAERLFLSRNTVSTHVASIYRKLEATNRSTAVAQATALGLLGG